MTDKRKHIGFTEGYIDNGFIDKKPFLQNETIISSDYTEPTSFIDDHESNISLPLTQINSDKNNEND